MSRFRPTRPPGDVLSSGLAPPEEQRRGPCEGRNRGDDPEPVSEAVVGIRPAARSLRDGHAQAGLGVGPTGVALAVGPPAPSRTVTVTGQFYRCGDKFFVPIEAFLRSE